MALFTQVDPETFVKPTINQPTNGRGAWTRKGIDFDYRYSLSEDPAQRIGTQAQVSLDHWAVAAGSYAIQYRLIDLGYLEPVAADEMGIYGPRTKAAVMAFQSERRDPDGGAQLYVDGIVGRSDARALFIAPVRRAERKYELPLGFLVGETYHESAMDPGAIGYYIYYGAEGSALEYRGVDRGMSQINSKYNPQISWHDAYNPFVSLEWSAKRMRSYYDLYKSRYPKQLESVLWDAALCAHNNPSAAGLWAKNGYAPTEQSKGYVNGVKSAIF